jgi:Tfp pilus assembly protein PilX
MVAIVVGIAFLASLAVNDSAGGAAAIEQAQQSAEAGLRETERRIAEMGGALRVSWSAVPSPSGGGYVVAARLVVEPSGEVGTAQFGVARDAVVAQNDLGKRLLDVGARMR